MKRYAVLLVVATALGVTAPTADAAFRTPRSCADGSTVFREGKVRLFTISGTVAGHPLDRFFLCSRWIRTPKRVYQTEESYDAQLYYFSIAARRRLTFAFSYAGGESYDIGVGWWHLRTGARRTTLFSDDQLGSLHRVVGDERGGIAYLQEGGDDDPGQRVGYARLKPNGNLGPPRERAHVPPEDPVVRRSLAVAEGVITWRTRSGTPGSVTTEGPRS